VKRPAFYQSSGFSGMDRKSVFSRCIIGGWQIKHVTTSTYVIKHVRVLTFTDQSIEHDGVVVQKASRWFNQSPAQNVSNAKLVLFQDMLNCIETTSFVFKNVVFFVIFKLEKSFGLYQLILKRMFSLVC